MASGLARDHIEDEKMKSKQGKLRKNPKESKLKSKEDIRSGPTTSRRGKAVGLC